MLRKALATAALTVAAVGATAGVASASNMTYTNEANSNDVFQNNGLSGGHRVDHNVVGGVLDGTVKNLKVIGDDNTVSNLVNANNVAQNINIPVLSHCNRF